MLTFADVSDVVSNRTAFVKLRVGPVITTIPSRAARR